MGRGIKKCFKKFFSDCAKGCTVVTEKYEADGDPTSSKFVCTKVTQAWVDQARAEMEYRRNRRVCPHCKLELPMLPKPMYAQEQSKNLWKVEPDVLEKESQMKPDVLKGSNSPALLNRNSYRSVPFLEKKKKYVYFYNGNKTEQQQQNKYGIARKS